MHPHGPVAVTSKSPFVWLAFWLALGAQACGSGDSPSLETQDTSLDTGGDSDSQPPGVVGLDQSCLESSCAAGLHCDPTGYDFSASEIVEATCHAPCGVDADCQAGQQCRPSTVGFFTLQQNASGNGIPCVIDVTPSGCDEDAGFRCSPLSTGHWCARETSACGSPVALADRRTGSPPAEQWCNSGQPQEIPGVGLVGGSRFCDRLTSLQDPPVDIECQRVDDSHPPSLGLCFGRCERDDGTFTDCPTGMRCDVDPAQSAFGSLLPDPTNTTLGVKECTTAEDCGDARYRCEDRFGTRVCFRSFGTCTTSASGR